MEHRSPDYDFSLRPALPSRFAESWTPWRTIGDDMSVSYLRVAPAGERSDGLSLWRWRFRNDSRRAVGLMHFAYTVVDPCGARTFRSEMPRRLRPHAVSDPERSFVVQSIDPPQIDIVAIVRA